MLQYKNFHILQLTFLIASLDIALSIAPVHAQPAPTIFAGEGMGQISLGEKRASILKKLGKPTKSLNWESMPMFQDVWTNKKTNSRLTVLYTNDTNRVMQIETTSPKFFSPDDLSVRTQAAKIFEWARNGKGYLLILKPNRTQDPATYALISDRSRGLAFFVTDRVNGKLTESWVTQKVIVFPVGKAPVYSSSAYSASSKGPIAITN